jgi:hypothetical protein
MIQENSCVSLWCSENARVAFLMECRDKFIEAGRLSLMADCSSGLCADLVQEHQ